MLKGFSHFWNLHTNLYPITVWGYDIEPELPDNFNFVSLGKQRPAEEWSNGLIDALYSIKDEYFVLMLEDFWLYDKADLSILPTLANALKGHDTLRLDLSGNRMAYKQARSSGHLAGYDIVTTPKGTPYQMSFQAAIWHKWNMLEVLKLNETPWQAEIEGSKRVNKKVLGTNLLKYQPVWRARTKKWQLNKLGNVDKGFLTR